MAKQQERRLPEGWQWVKLGDVFSVRSGKFLPAQSMNIEGTYSVYGGNGITGQHNEYLFDDPQIVIGRVGALCGVVHRTTPRSWITDNALYISERKKEFDDGFMVQLLRFLNLNQLSNSMAQPVISGKAIYGVEVPLPPIAEQKRLVAILNDRFAAIETARKATESQLEAAKALPAAYLREVFNSPEAEGWRSVKLGSVCFQDRQIISAESDRANDLPYLSLEHIQSQTGQIILDPKIHSEQSGKSSTFFFDNRHILYGKLRPYLNKVALPEFSGRCTTEAIPLLPLEDIDREFLAWTLRRDETVHIAMQGKTGSRMPRADIGDLFQMSIPLPPIAEQKRLVAILNDRFSTIETIRKAIEDQLEAINALPATLLRQAFNGEL